MRSTANTLSLRGRSCNVWYKKGCLVPLYVIFRKKIAGYLTTTQLTRQTKRQENTSAEVRHLNGPGKGSPRPRRSIAFDRECTID
jgi:hypothetical protein